MPDSDKDFKTEAAKALDHIQSIIDRIEANGGTTVGYVRTRIAWVIGILCAFFGFIAGHIR